MHTNVDLTLYLVHEFLLDNGSQINFSLKPIFISVRILSMKFTIEFDGGKILTLLHPSLISFTNAL